MGEPCAMLGPVEAKTGSFGFGFRVWMALGLAALTPMGARGQEGGAEAPKAEAPKAEGTPGGTGAPAGSEIVPQGVAPLRAEPELDEGALAILEETMGVYRGLGAYSSEWEATYEDGPERLPASRMRLAFERPGRLALRRGGFAFVNDGKSLTWRGFDKYETRAFVEPPTLAQVRGRTIGTILAEGPLHLELAFLTLSAEDAKAELFPTSGGRRLAGLVREPDVEFSGKAYPCLLFLNELGRDYRILIDPETKFLAAYQRVYNGRRGWATDPFDVGPLAYERIEASGSLPTRGGEVFALDTTGLTRTRLLEEALLTPGGAAAGFEVLTVSEPTEDFRLTILGPDSQSGTLLLNKKDLAGSPLILADWASDDEASMDRIGDLVPLLVEANKAGDAGGRLRVIAVTRDAPEGTLDDIDAALIARRVFLTTNENGHIALSDPVQLDPILKPRENLPTLAVLDGRGQVRLRIYGWKPEEGVAAVRAKLAELARER